MTLHGFLNVNKPEGLTSHDVVARIRRWAKIRQVGHGGTLDPQATGVLPVGVGHGTRMLEFLPDSKVYRADVFFGISTDSYDAAGQVTAERSAEHLRREDVDGALQRFVGIYQQRPPVFSAVRHEGTRLYHLARQGVAVDVPPRPVRIDSAAVLDWKLPVATLLVHCGRGTYMRSLAHDLGEALGCGAHLRHLVRVEDGGFRLEESVTLGALQAALEGGDAASVLYPLDFPVQDWPVLRLNAIQVTGVLNGQKICPGGSALSGVPLWQSERRRGVAPDGRLIALLERKPLDPCWQPFKVFPTQ